MTTTHRMRAANGVPANYVPIPYPKWITLPGGKELIVQDKAEELALLAQHAPASDIGGSGSEGIGARNAPHSATEREGTAAGLSNSINAPAPAAAVASAHAAELARPPSAGSIRMRRTRERRRAGRQLLQGEIDECKVTALVAAGHLAEADQRNAAAILRALVALVPSQ